MRGSAVAVVVSVFWASGAFAQNAATLPGSLSPVGVQAGSETWQGADIGLTRTVRFRIESVPGLADHAGRPALVDPYGHRRRLASTFDLYPDATSGFHLSLGMRSRPRPARRANMSAISADLRARLDAPSATQALRTREGIKRALPVAMMGWTEALGERSVLRLDGGAMAIRARKDTLLAMAGLDRGRSRIGATAQLSFLRKF